ncbi:FecR domain-containing protein [Pseudomonas citrulli]|uniref:FecR domain-containing protein n=1 Tax=Pseudomonas citrulli TaxID=3064347 RepID=A0ABT9C129_9PSED|nr:FecR domain-containing protein [Pseudomonas sp. K18]MDO7897283.1 FecR domain-containing protein [Pseudomonas sp. K18]
MPNSDARVLEAAVVDQAIHWLVRLRFNPADEHTQRTFEHWLQQRPEHLQAWRRVEALGDDFAGLPPDLARRTLKGSRAGLHRRQGLKLLGVLATVGGAAWLARDYTPLPALFAQQHSGTGERKRVQLDDGSVIQLNSDSAIDSYFDAQRRLVILRRGEIIVNTGADAGAAQPRPFWVQTRDGLVRSRDARFLAYARDDGTLLSVQRGAVTVFPGTRQTPLNATVQAGSQRLITSTGVAEFKDNGLDPWGWSDGVISARDMRLGDFIEALSRYRPGVLRCAEEVAGLRVSGTFQLANTDQVLALVAQSLHLRIDYRTHYWVTLSADS